MKLQFFREVREGPERGSHAPGTFFYYNNWDFNALGTIFERQFHAAIGREFRDKIALPIQMEDFRLEDMYYKRAEPDDPTYVKSLHPAYLFSAKCPRLG